MKFPSPQAAKEFIESLSAESADAVLQAVDKAMEANSVEKGVDPTLYYTSLVCAAAIYLRKRFEVWTSFVQGKDKPAMGKKEYWVKYEGTVIKPWVTNNIPLRESPSQMTQQKIREWALEAMKEARPRKRMIANSVLTFKGWTPAQPVEGRRDVIRKLRESGNTDLAKQIAHLTRSS